MGGLDAGEINREEHDYALWEKRVDALMILGTARGHLNVDGLRRALEDMGEDTFETMTYYERWIAAINQNFVEAGLYTLAELGTKMAEVAARGDTYGDVSGG